MQLFTGRQAINHQATSQAAHLRFVRATRCMVSAAIGLSFLLGCDGGPGDLPPPGLPCTSTEDFSENPEKAALFSPDHMLCIALTMPAERFEQLRIENRFDVPNDQVIDEMMARFTTSCVQPFGSKFTWQETQLAVDGVVVQRVGIRKKGLLGSVLGEGLFKPSLKLKLDRAVAGQRLGNTKRITLNNNNQDPTRMRTCLAYALFTAAGYPAPRCNLANVMVNGRSLGAYVHVEPVKRRLLRRLFGRDDGALYEGALVDLTPAYMTKFSTGSLGRWEKKTSATDSAPNTTPKTTPKTTPAEAAPTVGRHLHGLMTALQAPDSTLLAALKPVLNLQRFIQFWALEALINHSDGYSSMRNNFFIYFDPNDADRAVFLPWGADNVLNGGAFDKDTAPLIGFMFAELPRRLSRIGSVSKQFNTELARLRDTVWRTDVILAQIDRFEKQINTAQVDDAFSNEVQKLRQWIRARPGEITKLLNAGIATGKSDTASCMTLPLGGITDPDTGLDIFTALVFAW